MLNICCKEDFTSVSWNLNFALYMLKFTLSKNFSHTIQINWILSKLTLGNQIDKFLQSAASLPLAYILAKWFSKVKINSDLINARFSCRFCNVNHPEDGFGSLKRQTIRLESRDFKFLWNDGDILQLISLSYRIGFHVFYWKLVEIEKTIYMWKYLKGDRVNFW